MGNSCLSGGATAFPATLKTISTDLTLQVKSTGGDFSTIQEAIDAIGQYYIEKSKTVTISVDAGVFTTANTVSFSHPVGERVKILGATPTAVSITSIQSVGNRTADTSGDNTLYYRDYVVNVASTTGISAGQFVLIDSISGGYQALYIVGCHEIMSVDSGNSRLTIRVYSQNTTFASGNTVTADAVVVKTIISCSDTTKAVFDCLNTKLWLVDNIVFRYSSGYGGKNDDFGTVFHGAVDVKYHSTVGFGRNVGIVRGKVNNLNVSDGSYVEAERFFISQGNYAGMSLWFGSCFRVRPDFGDLTKRLIITGCYYGGAQVQSQSTLCAVWSYFIGNGYGVISREKAGAYIDGSTISGNSVGGLYADWGGLIEWVPNNGGFSSNNVTDVGVINTGFIGLTSGGVIPSITKTGGVTHGNTTIEMTSNEYVGVGMKVSGTNIPASTTVSAVSSDGVTVTLSQSATGSSSGITFTFTCITNIALNTLNTTTGAIITG